MAINTAAFTRKNAILLLFCAILFLGFILRSYNLNFPSIGYHDMKENEYLGVAQEMQRTGDFLSRRVYFYDAFDENSNLKISPQPSLISYQIILSWKLFGENLWSLRLCNIVFGLLSIPVMYYLAFALFRRVSLSLFCSLLLAIMPLGVFFSRNIQPESPAFFFMLLGNLFYLRFGASLKKYYLLLGGCSFVLSGLYASNFIFGAIACLFFFPFQDFSKNKKELLKFALPFILPYVALFSIGVWLSFLRPGHFLKLDKMRLWDVFFSGYWQQHGRQIWWYIRGENFTLVFAILSLSGVIIAFLNPVRNLFHSSGCSIVSNGVKRKSLLDRYIIGWVLTALIYLAVYSDPIYQANYYQMPFLGMVCILSTYAVSSISQMLKKIIKAELLVFIMLIVLGLSVPSAYNSIVKMHATVFLGLDVAGESLKELTAPDERIFLHTHAQGYGIARYARRYAGWTPDLEDFKTKEKKYNIKYICFYPIEFSQGLKLKNLPLYEYIRNNYHVKEIGLIEEPRQLFYAILEKGKGSSDKDFLQSFSGPMRLRTIYRIFGRYIFFYSLRPVALEQPEK